MTFLVLCFLCGCGVLAMFFQQASGIIVRADVGVLYALF